MKPEDSRLTLEPRDVAFLKYFIDSYTKNFSKGNMDDSHHDAVAIVLFLAEKLNLSIY